MSEFTLLPLSRLVWDLTDRGATQKLDQLSVEFVRLWPPSEVARVGDGVIWSLEELTVSGIILMSNCALVMEGNRGRSDSTGSIVGKHPLTLSPWKIGSATIEYSPMRAHSV